jgi:hypothetical protein
LLVGLLDGREARFQTGCGFRVGPREEADFQQTLFLQPFPSPAGNGGRR